ncbi:MAG: ATP-binding protein [Nostoc sp.]|uniref:ATP-binding protein n=1 Tax=Nostoc sp. TaxID=1180 RepID=UPI002FF7DD3C
MRVGVRLEDSPTKTLGDRNLVAWVEDRGQGLSATEKEQIFVPFYSTKPEGTGLGLAITHEIVTRNAGYIHLQSQPGCTRFSIYLPICDQDINCNG